MEDWIRMFVKTPFSIIEGEAERAELIRQAAERLRGALYKNGRWYADYVRLRMKAVKA